MPCRCGSATRRKVFCRRGFRLVIEPAGGCAARFSGGRGRGAFSLARGRFSHWGVMRKCAPSPLLDGQRGRGAFSRHVLPRTQILASEKAPRPQRLVRQKIWPHTRAAAGSWSAESRFSRLGPLRGPHVPAGAAIKASPGGPIAQRPNIAQALAQFPLSKLNCKFLVEIERGARHGIWEHPSVVIHNCGVVGVPALAGICRLKAELQRQP